MSVFSKIDLFKALQEEKQRIRSVDDDLIDDVKRIFIQDQYSEKKILENIRSYNQSYEMLDEDGLDNSRIFSIKEIELIAIKYRLRFLDSQLYKGAIPSETLNEVQSVSTQQGKNIRTYKILASTSFFKLKEKIDTDALLFTPTSLGNYYLLFSWGYHTKWSRAISCYPLRNFETLFACILSITLMITLSFPTHWITMDKDATYLSMYRIAAFFHMLIFDSAVAAFVLFGFYSNFSTSQWNHPSFHE